MRGAPWAGFAWGSRSYLMGVLNVTPDSFSDGGQFLEPAQAIAQAHRLAADGADLIDIGAESTRPGAPAVSAAEEWARLEPVLAALAGEPLPPISLDTTKAEVAEQALSRGWVRIINDVHGFHGDPALPEVCARHQADVVLMFNARLQPPQGDLVAAVTRFFAEAVDCAVGVGLAREHCVLDPGIGFGLQPEQSLELLQRLGELRMPSHALLLGTSRKSFIGHYLDLPVQQRDLPTVATTVAGIQQGADLFRVHDVPGNAQAARMADLIYRR